MPKRPICTLGLLLYVMGTGFTQSNPCQTTQTVVTLGSGSTSQAVIVYDPNQNVCWLANANLAANTAMQTSLGVSGVEPNGSMDYGTALKWVAELNASNNGAGYLGHNDWQLPSAALTDKTCADIGTQGGNFGLQCTDSALGNLYSVGLKQTFPASVAAGMGAKVGPIRNLKASYYWAAQNNGGTSGTNNGGQEFFSFAVGLGGGTTINDTYYYALPMVPGAIGTAPACPAGAGVVAYTSGPAAGSAVYDCVTGYSWPSDANLAASNAFGINGTLTLTYNSGRTITAPKISGGAMPYTTAVQWLQAMSSAKYLDSSAWQIPATSTTLQDLFSDLSMVAGDSRIQWSGSTGPFQNLQPSFYWACGRDQAGTSQSPCVNYSPADGTIQLQWSYDFDYGFQSTSALVQRYFVMVYYPVTAASGPAITLAANAEGEDLTIAPNMWVEIKGANLAPAGMARIWQGSDFVNGKMPTQVSGVSVTVDGKSAFVYYVSPTQVNVLTPPDALSFNPQVVLTNNGAQSPPFSALGQTVAPSFFVLGDGQHLVATHADNSLVGPPAFSVPGYTFTPAKPGETIVLYANGFGATSVPLVSGSATQIGTLNPLPQVTIGGTSAAVQFAGLISPGLFQFNVVVPSKAADGDLVIRAATGSAITQPGILLTVHK